MELGTVNDLLGDADLGITLDQGMLDCLLNTYSFKLLSDALFKASGDDEGAKNWLITAIEKVRTKPKRAQPPTSNSSIANESHQQRPAVTDKPAPVRTEVTSTRSYVDTEQQSRRNAAEQLSAEREFIGHHVYGTKAALHLGLDETRGNTHTVRLEGAQSIGNRKFNWNEKISIQLTQQELPHVACVLFGWVDLCEYNNHGPQKNKGFKLMTQEQNGKKGLFVNIMEAGKPLCAVPVIAVDLYYLRNLVLGQLMKNSPQLDSSAVILSLKSYASMIR